MIKKGVIEEGENIVVYDDLAGSFNVPFEPENTVFKRGLGKIAAGYAAKNSVSRKNMKCVIDSDRNVIKERIMIAPFLPTVKSEGFSEENKHRSLHYPVHSLVLYANKSSRLIYCYVELFSAFQFYVLLDDDYDGDDIYRSYVYDLISEKEIDYKEYANSIPGQSDIFDSLPSYRVIDANKFFQLTHASKEDQKFYYHRNFHAIEAFTNYYFLNKKLKCLEANTA
ncbi:hypothetical protein M2R29_21310 [Aeromonas hydrophila]|uniref:hypothetical protein n=1 Tax=Aeromonas hydrophila TaxID=644 RepID=UPI00207C84A1|nr:hypothetical protein [Aeromonas hydrophila]MCO4210468.1 hypothetical protein [Aeromonas hydrophila]